MPGQGQNVLQLAQRLGLSRADVNVVWKAFKKFDMDGGGTVDIEEFIVVGRLEHSEIVGKMLFRLMDKNYSNTLDFEEFLCAVWNVCSCDHDNLGVLTFELFDLDGGGSIDGEELMFIGNLYFGFRPPKNVVLALKHMDSDSSGAVDVKEFLRHMKNAEVILQPAFDVQYFLRQCTMGQAAWDAVTRFRNKSFPRQTIFSILNKSKSDQHGMKCAALDVVTREVQRASKESHVSVPGAAARKLDRAHKFIANVKAGGGSHNNSNSGSGSSSSNNNSHTDNHSASNGGHDTSHSNSNSNSSHGHDHGHDGHSHGGQSTLHDLQNEARRLQNEGSQMGAGGRVKGVTGQHVNERDVLDHVNLGSPDKLKPLHEIHHHPLNRTVAVGAIYEAVTGTSHASNSHEHERGHNGAKRAHNTHG